MEPTIILIIGHFLIFAEVRKIIPRKYQKFMEKGKFRSSACNSVTRRKLLLTAKILSVLAN